MNAKHVICFGDSNTHGYCGDPAEFDGLPQPSSSMRYSESSRWPRLLQDKLGEDYLILDEGLNGRTTVFEDPYRQGLTGAGYIWPCLMSHKPVDLLILMLGTNDAKEWYGATALQICAGMEYIVCRAQNTPCWTEKGPNILVIAPPPIGEGYEQTESFPEFGPYAREKTLKLAKLYEQGAKRLGCAFLDAAPLAELNPVDRIHMTRRDCEVLASELAKLVPELCR